ncbi:MAG: radical SAM protein [Candidatus Erginobacter occultus]|nr:radical SAM protein [Candidatus Erginobacter occultus]
MKILLATPINRSYVVMPSLGLGYLAARVSRQEFDVTILNCQKERMDFADFRDYIKLGRFDLIGFQMHSYDLNQVRRHLEIIKSTDPSVITVVGGAHPSAAPLMTMEYLPSLDYAFRGEADIGFPLFLNKLREDPFRPKNLAEVPGLVYREKGKIRINQPGYIRHLDQLGFPAWDLLEPQNYPEASHGAFAKDFPTAPIIISRGCTFQCTFCAGKSITGPGVRFRSIDNVLEEMRYLNQEFGINEFLVEDENLTFCRDITEEFCRKIIDSPMSGISWSCPSGIRIDTIDEEILGLMEQSGCYSVALGIEFGTQKMLDQTKKQLTLSTIEEKVKLLRGTGIKTTGFFMLGVPGETVGDIKETIKLACRLKIDRAQFNNFMPLPGSELGENLRAAGCLTDLDWGKLFVHNVSFASGGIKPGRIKRLQRMAYLRFYLRPGIIFGLLREISSFRHLKFLCQRFLDAMS